MTKEIVLRHSITLESGCNASGEASEWARSLAEGVGLPEERVYALDLCIVEMVTNVVNHAYEGAGGEIRLDLDLGNAAAVLTILDRGPAFDPLAVAPRTVPASLDEATIGGYGIHLVRSTASRCAYERRDGRNVFTAWFGEAHPASPGP